MASALGLQSNPGYIDRHGCAQHALDKTVDALRAIYNKIPLQGAQFFRTESPKGGVYTEASYGTMVQLPTINQDSDDLPFVTPSSGFKKTFTVVNYRSAIQAERTTVEDELEPLVRKQMSGMLTSGRLLLEYSMANVLNNATSTSYLGSDGVALASASHPYERKITGTWSNLETASALSTANFSTARLNLRKRANEWGDTMALPTKAIVVPPDLEEKALQIMASEKVAENALNNKNVWMNKYSVIVWDYLTDTNAWFLLADMPDINKGLVYVEAVAPNVMSTEGKDKSTDIIWGQRLRMRFTVGHTVCREIQYNAGA